jgi:uncharacterized membrane protein
MALASPQKTKIVLPGSWDLVRPSTRLVRDNLDTLLWLVILPSVVGLLANQLLANIVKRFSALLGEKPTDSQMEVAFRGLAHDLTQTTPGRVAVLLFVISLLWTVLVYPATVAFMVKASRGEHADVFSSIRAGWKYFWRVYALAILTAVIVMLGLILFIVPGLIFLRRYFLAPYYLVDRDLTIREAMKQSARESKLFTGYVWGVIGVILAFAVMSSLANTVKYVGPIVGLAIVYLYFFGPVLRYRTIAEATGHVSKASKK